MQICNRLPLLPVEQPAFACSGPVKFLCFEGGSLAALKWITVIEFNYLQQQTCLKTSSCLPAFFVTAKIECFLWKWGKKTLIYSRLLLGNTVQCLRLVVSVLVRSREKYRCMAGIPTFCLCLCRILRNPLFLPIFLIRRVVSASVVAPGYITAGVITLSWSMLAKMSCGKTPGTSVILITLIRRMLHAAPRFHVRSFLFL